MLARLQSPGSSRIFYHLVLFFCEFSWDLSTLRCDQVHAQRDKQQRHCTSWSEDRDLAWGPDFLRHLRSQGGVQCLKSWASAWTKAWLCPSPNGEYWSSGLDSDWCVGGQQRCLSHRDNTRFLQGLKLSCILHGVYHLQRGKRKLILERQKNMKV